MKRHILTTIILMSLAISLVACSSSPIEIVPSGSQTVTASSKMDESLHLLFSTGTKIHGNEEGCYIVLPNETNTQDLIYYADYETQQLAVLCTQPNCTHDDNSCTAWISCPANIPDIAVVNDKIILIYPGNPYFFDKYGEDALPRIEIRDVAGRFLKEVVRFKSGIKLAEQYAINKNDIYVLEKDVSQSTLNVTKMLVKINIDSGKKETVASFQPESTEDYFWIGTTENQFIMKKISVQEDLTDDAQEARLSQQHQLFTVTAKGQMNPVFKQWKHLEGMEGFVDNRLFYITPEEMEIITNISEEANNIIVKDKIFDSNETNFIAYSEPYLLLSSSVHRNETFDAPIFYSLNMENQQIEELSIITELGDDSNFSVYAQTDNSFWVLYYDEKAEQQVFALISKKDLWNNKSEWKKFTLI